VTPATNSAASTQLKSLGIASGTVSHHVPGFTVQYVVELVDDGARASKENANES
jgi:hypothetical protein